MNFQTAWEESNVSIWEESNVKCLYCIAGLEDILLG